MTETLDLNHPLMIELRRLAAIKDHRLAGWMTGERPLAQPAVEAAIRHLEGRTVKDLPPCETAETPAPAPAAVPDQPRKLPPITAYADKVPAGRYAVPSLSGANDLDFYEVDRPKNARVPGMCFVEQVVGGKENWPVKGYRARMVLQAIVDHGVAEAGQLYGQQIGECSDCGSHLTDLISRYNGRGPVCAAKHGIVRAEPPADWNPGPVRWAPKYGEPLEPML